MSKCEYFGKNFRIEVDTKHTEGEVATVKNIHNLSQKDLVKRKVDIIDIVNDPIPDKKYKKEEDPKFFKSKLRPIGPLSKDWMKTTRPILCAYKLVRVKFEKWIIGHRIEQAIQDHAFRETFLEVNRQAFCWMDEWINMDEHDIRKFEYACAEKQNLAVSASCSQIDQKQIDKALKEADEHKNDEFENEMN